MTQVQPRRLHVRLKDGRSTTCLDGSRLDLAFGEPVDQDDVEYMDPIDPPHLPGQMPAMMHADYPGPPYTPVMGHAASVQQILKRERLRAHG